MRPHVQVQRPAEADRRHRPVLSRSSSPPSSLPAAGLAAPPAGGGSPLVALALAGRLRRRRRSATSRRRRKSSSSTKAKKKRSIDKIAIEGEDAGDFNLSRQQLLRRRSSQRQHCYGLGRASCRAAPARSTRRSSSASTTAGRRRASKSPAPAVAPQLTFSPASYDFGLQPVHSKAATPIFQLDQQRRSARCRSATSNFARRQPAASGPATATAGGRWLQPGESCSRRSRLQCPATRSPTRPNCGPRVQRRRLHRRRSAAKAAGRSSKPTPNPVDFGAADGRLRPARRRRSPSPTPATSRPASSSASSPAATPAASSCSTRTAPASELMPAASCTAHVRFRPQSAGAQGAPAWPSSATGDGGTMVGAERRRRRPGGDPGCPPAFDFGAQPRRHQERRPRLRRPQRRCARRSSSARVAIVGADLDQFALAGDECTGETLGARRRVPGPRPLRPRQRRRQDGQAAGRQRRRRLHRRACRRRGTDGGRPSPAAAPRAPGASPAAGRRRAPRAGRTAAASSAATPWPRARCAGARRAHLRGAAVPR